MNYVTRRGLSDFTGLPVQGSQVAHTHQGAGAEEGGRSRLPDTGPGLYLREHISSKLFPHQLIKKNTLGNGQDT